MLGIGALLERRPGQLSGGQQQRVALGRAIVAEAPVCLMDEPLSNLDAQLRAEMRREILALQRRLGITMLYVTHDQTEAMGMADQVVLLRARPGGAGRAAGGALRTAGQRLRRRLRRRAADEPAAAGAGAVRRWCRAASTARRSHRRRVKRRTQGCGRRRCGLPSAGCPRVVAARRVSSAPTRCSPATPGAHRLLARVPGRVALPAAPRSRLGFDPADLHLFAADGRRSETVAQPETAPA